MPPRPQLSYTVQQQRQIVEALIADRENARYTSQVVRYRSGLSTLPPPPAPPATVAAPDLSVAQTRTPAPSEPPLAEQETLVDFLAALRRLFADEDPAPEPAAGPLPADPGPGPGDAAAPGPTADPTPLPPAQNAVAARMATHPHLVDEILDDTVAQAPLPPLQPADAARDGAPQEAVVDAAAAPPLPAPRPAAARLARILPPSARPLVPPPPPLKPLVPVGAVPPPADGDRSASLATPATPRS